MTPAGSVLRGSGIGLRAGGGGGRSFQRAVEREVTISRLVPALVDSVLIDGVGTHEGTIALSDMGTFLAVEEPNEVEVADMPSDDADEESGGRGTSWRSAVSQMLS